MEHSVSRTRARRIHQSRDARVRKQLRLAIELEYVVIEGEGFVQILHYMNVIKECDSRRIAVIRSSLRPCRAATAQRDQTNPFHSACLPVHALKAPSIQVSPYFCRWSG